MYDSLIREINFWLSRRELPYHVIPFGFRSEEIVFCHKTSRSKKPKPLKDNFYIVRKSVETKWGTKVIVVDINKNEVWADAANITSLPPEISKLVPKELTRTLEANLYDKILDDCTPAIGEVLKKNHAGLEIYFTSGQKVFVSRKIIYPDSIYYNASPGETISLNIPVWFAEKNKIIENRKQS